MTESNIVNTYAEFEYLSQTLAVNFLLFSNKMPGRLTSHGNKNAWAGSLDVLHTLSLCPGGTSGSQVGRPDPYVGLLLFKALPKTF